MRKARAVAGLGGAVLVVGAGVAAAIGFGGSAQEASGRSALPPGTATVTRQTLTETETVSGSLGYGKPTTLTNRGGNGAVITWMPEEGAVIKRGGAVYKVDEKPVVLLYGDVPFYRVLGPGADGVDVLQLENNLAALGYGGFTVDSDYTGATADAVRRWQEDLGVTETGSVQPAQVVAAPDAIRVTRALLGEGDLATGAVLTYTGTTRLVTVALDVAKQDLVSKGTQASVELPDGKQIRGSVSRVGTVATVSGSGSGAQQQQSTTIEVLVAIADQGSLGALDEAPVSVVLEAEQRKDVLTVPINALLALVEGGYGVQVVEGSATRYLRVQTGLFAGGRVEVSGDGLAEGMTVGVPR